jgi:hypothetical protein
MTQRIPMSPPLFTLDSALRLLAAGALLLGAALALPGTASATGCEASAKQARRACGFDVKDGLWEARATCSHLSDAGDRKECFADAVDESEETADECEAIFEARMEFCEASGEDRYDPPFTRGMFTTNFDNANPLWPLAAGNHWEYEGTEEFIVVEVLPATKRIGRVDCIVVNDVVADEDGLVVEDTDDWYGQATNGDVYYCGENAKDYEVFAGDDPETVELVSIDGSFKHGVDGAKAGLQMSATPAVGDIYRQEFALGDAEDGAEVLSTTYSYGDGDGLDRKVPRELAELFCDGDCVVTREFNLLEPDAEARKYYSPGVGLILEVEGREVVELVACNVDPRCEEL